MKILDTALFAAITGVSLASIAEAADAPGPSPRDAHAAECVAALDVNTQDLAEQVKLGQEGPRALLLERLTAGTAFVGDTYLHGSADEKEARALAHQALEVQKSLTSTQLAARQLACATEGAKLYDESNGLERAVIKRLAKKRMDKLLGGG